MSGLPEIQSAFQRHVLHGGEEAASHIVGSDAASAEERLRVYYQAYRLRLIEVLSTDFAGLNALTGDREFDALALEFIDAYPSTRPSVRWFGERLPAFLEGRDPWRQRPELAEMARLEWLRGRAFDAADTPPLTADAFAARPAENWPSMRLRFHPSLHLVELAWNVPAIWQSVSSEQPLPKPESCGSAVTWVIWRRELIVYWRSLSAPEAEAISGFRSGRDFAGICKQLCNWHTEAEVPAIAASLLRHWVADGVIGGILSD